ncbi:MAG TPA: 3-hydroxyacyl-CoA dehydrogenase NAD-binding domain-containing protein [Candidatus Obscuribacterales bacterium]
MNIKKVAVLGAGTMGSSIAVALIGSGYQVLLKDVKQEFLDAGLQRIDKFLESKVKKGLSQQDAQKQRALVKTSTDFSGFQQVDLVIEAVLEEFDIKRTVFAELEKHCRADAILATNTSSLPITRIAGCTAHPERVVGMHFFNPAHLMKLVEIIPGLQTSDQTVETALAFARSLDKLAVRVEECASFLVNRLLGRYMNEALWALQARTGTVEEIDKAVCDYVMPIGPFALRDMNGADIGLAVAKFNYGEYGERFAVPPILQAMVDERLLGQKTGRGFYLYDQETKKRQQGNPDVERLVQRFAGETSSTPLDADTLFLPMINEAFLVLQEKVCALEDLDPALKAGLGMRKGPLELAQEMGLSDCLQKIETLHARHGERFRPAPLLKRIVWSGCNQVVA